MAGKPLRCTVQHGHCWGLSPPWATFHVGRMPHSNCATIQSEKDHCASVMLRSKAKLGATIDVGVMPHSDCVILWSETNHCASVMLRSMAKLWGKALRATIYVGKMPHCDCEPFPLSCQFYKI